MNFDSSKPIYEQIIEEFKRKLVRGELKAQDKMPSQRELAQQIKVNPNTIQRAYREMELLGMTETIRGQGTFVVNDQQLINNFKTEMAERTLNNFVQEITALGYEQQQILELLQQHLQSHLQPD